MGYSYDQGEGRYKHKWRKDEAGFEPGNRGPVGRCHSSIDPDVAQALLDGGIEEFDDDDYPARIFGVYRGVPYVAVPTEPGKSYHGYPWRGRISPLIRKALWARADESGYKKKFKKWLSDYEN